MTNDTLAVAGEQSSMSRRDEVQTPSVLRENESSYPGAWYRFKQSSSSGTRFSAPRTKTPPTHAGTGWKPRSMTASVLVPIAVAALSLAAVIEFLAQRSRTHGGLALVSTPENISQYALLSYLYLPTVLAAIFSLVWNWVDLDVKRMQPWFELSKPEGATAENSLFLDYPYDFVGIVPFKALKRRHWPVFLSSTVVVAIFWLVTPLQSSILGTKAVSSDHTVSLNVRSRLAPLADQRDVLDPRVMITGYSIGWLGQDFPPWTTDSYAIVPFYVDNDPGEAQPGTNWTAKTTKLSTELDCWPAVVKQSPPPQQASFNISSGYGCSSPFVFGDKFGIQMAYAGWRSGTTASMDLSDFSGNCPKTDDTVHQFVLIWAEQTLVNSTSNQTAVDVTALFCQSHYYQQEVSVTVAADTFKPYDDSIVALGPRLLLTDRDFQSEVFELLIATGQILLSEPISPPEDVPFFTSLDQSTQLAKTELILPASPMVGYALAGQNESLSAYRDPKRLQQAFNHAHQFLFSSAVSYLWVNETIFDDPAATSSYFQYGIVVSRLFSALVEGLLVVAAISILALLRSCRLSVSRLESDPSSLSRHVRIFQHSQAVNEIFYDLDCSDDKSLSKMFPNDHFRLSNDASRNQKVAIERLSHGKHGLAEIMPSTQTGYYKPFRPMALRQLFGTFFVLIQIGALVTIQILKWQETIQQGLTRPTMNFEVLQLLENFIPTIFATLTEPVLVQLNRFLCVLQPFKALATGRSIAANSVDITYASFPPQFVFWRAFKARHFLLAFMCTAAFLSNVLAVGMSALFKELPTEARYAQEFRPTLAPRFNSSAMEDFLNPNWMLPSTFNYKDHLYLAMSNISLGTPLPPWTSTEFFFQPHIGVDLPTSSNRSTFVVSTRGFGALANCVPASLEVVPGDPPLPPGANDLCHVDGKPGASYLLRAVLQARPTTSAAAMELPYFSDSRCSNNVTYAWGRVEAGQDMNRTLLANFADCSPSFQTAMFNVTHDVHGNVISYQRTSDFASSLESSNSTGDAYRLLSASNAFINNGESPFFHNDTVARDWMNYLLVLSLNSRDIVNGTKPLPDPAQLTPTMEVIYSRLFALLLSINQQLFEAADPEAIIVHTRITQEDKIFMADSAFLITTTILGLNIVAVGMFYASALVNTLPRMPTSIGSLLAYVASSRMVQERGPPEKEKGVQTYSFGRYIGVDKEPHLGIDIDPYVALIDPDSVKEGNWLLSAMRKKSSKMSLGDGPWL